MSTLTFPRFVFRPTTVVRVDVPGWDWMKVADAEEYARALADGWLPRPETVVADAEQNDAPESDGADVVIDVPAAGDTPETVMDADAPVSRKKRTPRTV